MGDPDRPAQRRLTARMWTSAGWLTGTLHVPIDVPLLSFLNREEEFLTLTDAQLPWQRKALPFLALQRNAALVVVPETEEVEGATEGPVSHQVSCLLDGGVVMGTLRLPRDERVSDRLTRRQRFFVLRDCTVGIDVDGGRQTIEGTPAAIINGRGLVGVAET